MVVLVTDNPEAGALERAHAAGVATEVITDRERPREVVVAETLHALRRHDVDCVALAGYLRLVPPKVVAAYDGRMLNVHPALLPAFGGKGMYGDHVHRAVLDAGVALTGPTVHLVTAEYDRGQPLAQWPVPVLPRDTVESLRGRVQEAERALYPLVLDSVSRALAKGKSADRLQWKGSRLGLFDEEADGLTQRMKSSLR